MVLEIQIQSIDINHITVAHQPPCQPKNSDPYLPPSHAPPPWGAPPLHTLISQNKFPKNAVFTNDDGDSNDDADDDGDKKEKV